MSTQPPVIDPDGDTAITDAPPVPSLQPGRNISQMALHMIITAALRGPQHGIVPTELLKAFDGQDQDFNEEIAKHFVLPIDYDNKLLFLTWPFDIQARAMALVYIQRSRSCFVELSKPTNQSSLENIPTSFSDTRKLGFGVSAHIGLRLARVVLERISESSDLSTVSAPSRSLDDTHDECVCLYTSECLHAFYTTDRGELSTLDMFVDEENGHDMAIAEEKEHEPRVESDTNKFNVQDVLKKMVVARAGVSHVRRLGMDSLVFARTTRGHAIIASNTTKSARMERISILLYWRSVTSAGKSLPSAFYWTGMSRIAKAAVPDAQSSRYNARVVPKIPIDLV
ncbi:hypothetical protein FGRMN_10727 [Fusarium graminum]|nr:hypothetical protein FGRMN_10727 [Fusarium graminum]